MHSLKTSQLLGLVGRKLRIATTTTSLDNRRSKDIKWFSNVRSKMAEDVVSKDVDLFRETPIRLLGYANEVGEAFRSMIPKSWVASSYAIASLYAVSDASEKAYKSFQKDHHSKSVKYRKSMEVFLEAALWQALASVIIPGFTINRICHLTNFSLSRMAPALRTATRNKMTTVIGLGCIPFIVKPIDRFVDNTMEQLVPLTKKILLQEAVIEESLHIAVEGHKDTFGDLQR